MLNDCKRRFHEFLHVHGPVCPFSAFYRKTTTWINQPTCLFYMRFVSWSAEFFSARFTSKFQTITFCKPLRKRSFGEILPPKVTRYNINFDWLFVSYNTWKETIILIGCYSLPITVGKMSYFAVWEPKKFTFMLLAKRSVLLSSHHWMKKIIVTFQSFRNFRHSSICKI